jgi:hypothetical protein
VDLRWVVGVVGGKHTGGSSGGLCEWRALIEHGDGCAAAVKLEGKGEADDAGSGNADVGAVHRTSLVGCKSIVEARCQDTAELLLV